MIRIHEEQLTGLAWKLITFWIIHHFKFREREREVSHNLLRFLTSRGQSTAAFTDRKCHVVMIYPIKHKQIFSLTL